MGYRIRKYGLVIKIVCVMVSFALAMLIRFDFSMSRASIRVRCGKEASVLLAVRLSSTTYPDSIAVFGSLQASERR